MAISIGGTVVIDDSRNIVNVNDIRVGVVTITGSTGNIQTPGTITGAGFGVAGTDFSVSPSAGATNISPADLKSIILSFPTSVTRGTGNVRVSVGSTNGTSIRTYNAATAPEITVLNNTWAISMGATSFGTPSAAPVLPGFSTVFLVVPSTAIQGFAGLNTTGASSYSFRTSGAFLGASILGGRLICQSGGVQWIVAPSASEVSRTWDNRNDANTRAQAVSGCTGWFVPSMNQLQNPGYCCRIYWDSFSATDYWSSSDACAPESCGCASSMYFNSGGRHGGANSYKTQTKCVRSFRCVTY
jgi:hypothetical protein